ncbi:MAG: hypothetical protein KKB51_09415 [Candidatus Riflebacteria bacterium]|nr:hypothetical protein [Candidatus Riflebacteria bacterium]
MPNIVFVLGFAGVVGFVLLIFGHPERCPHCAKWFARVVIQRWYQGEEVVEEPIDDTQNARKISKRQYRYKEKYACKFCQKDWTEEIASYRELEVGVIKNPDVSAEKVSSPMPWWKKLAWATGLVFALFVISLIIFDAGILMDPLDQIHEYVRDYFRAVLSPFDGSQWPSRRTLLKVVEAHWILECDVEEFHQNELGGSWDLASRPLVASGSFEPPVWPTLPSDSAESVEGQVRVKEKRSFYTIVLREESSGKLYSTDHLFQKIPGNPKGIDPLRLDEPLFLKLQKSSSVWEGEIQESSDGNYFVCLEREKP